jgi:predicted transcriptional regulator
MPEPIPSAKPNGRRRSILDLAPLELECMNALWPLGRATVRDLQGIVSERRPRAYTTILTIMDRLAHKGVVTREKSGRAWVYRANFSAQEARERALAQVVTHFFGGSAEALRSHLAGIRATPPIPSPPQTTAHATRQRNEMLTTAPSRNAASSPNEESADSASMDDSLL